MQVILTMLAGLVPGMLLGGWLRARHLRRQHRGWPERWDLQPRPLFTAHERSLYRELRAALPQHLILAKVSLLRFCQAASQRDVRHWYDRLQPLTVSLLVCTPNGTAITAIDLEAPGSATASQSRALRLKEAVLATCRVRYLRCLPEQWPQPALLSAWVLGHAGAAGTGSTGQGGTLIAEPLVSAGDQLARRLRERRAERAARWAESGFAPDSFFAFDSRIDPAANSVPAPLDADDLATDAGSAPRRQG